jgi:tight adherence protein B
MEAFNFSNPMVLSVVAFFAVAALIGAVIFVMRDFSATSTEDRLDVLTGRKVRDDKKTETITKEELLREGVDGLFGIFSGFASRIENLSWLFEQADSPIKGEAFLGLTIGFGVLGVAGAAAGNAPVPLYPVAALVMSTLPLCWLLWRRRSRFKQFAKQLPDSLELISRALRSGHSLASGLHVVVEEMPPPLSTEFGIAYEEQNLGVPLEDALKSMLKRMPNMDLKFFITAVVIQRQAGGDMAEILDKISYIIRERFKIMGQVQALTGEGRISGVVLMILPIALFVAVYYLNPDYVMLLFTEELGRKMIAYAAVLQVLGAITIKKIVAIKI